MRSYHTLNTCTGHMEEVELSLVVFSYFRHYQEDKYEMKFREYISVAKHNINLLKSHMQLAW